MGRVCLDPAHDLFYWSPLHRMAPLGEVSLTAGAPLFELTHLQLSSEGQSGCCVGHIASDV